MLRLCEHCSTFRPAKYLIDFSISGESITRCRISASYFAYMKRSQKGPEVTNRSQQARCFAWRPPKPCRAAHLKVPQGRHGRFNAADFPGSHSCKFHFLGTPVAEQNIRAKARGTRLRRVRTMRYRISCNRQAGAHLLPSRQHSLMSESGPTDIGFLPCFCR